MERQEIIEQIQSVIQNYGYIHCYEDIVGNCMPPKPSFTSKIIDGVPYNDGVKEGFIQGFHMNNVTIVLYSNKVKAYDAFSLNYNKLPLEYLTECLNFLRRN